jgi:hypothetical protein
MCSDCGATSKAFTADNTEMAGVSTASLQMAAPITQHQSRMRYASPPIVPAPSARTCHLALVVGVEQTSTYLA